MRILKIETELISIPLKKPFKTALRQLSLAENVIVKIHTDDGIGFGGAPPTAVITGDTVESIKGAIDNYISPAIIGMDIEYFEEIMSKLQSCIYKNTSAKAAVDIALYDLFGKHYNIPLYKFFGGAKDKIETDITISVNSPEEMAKDAIKYLALGYKTLKTKVGIDSKLDINRVKTVREAVGYDVKIRLDANQGWTAKEAVKTIRQMEDMGLNIELVEQPVPAYDIEGLKFITHNVETPIMADESLFLPHDAFVLLKERAVDLLNIKLMKCGGLHNAQKINAIAQSCGVECMIGCMIESKIGITAAAHLGCGKLNITRADLDAVDLMAKDPIDGGLIVEGDKLVLCGGAGLGINGVKEVI